MLLVLVLPLLVPLVDTPVLEENEEDPAKKNKQNEKHPDLLQDIEEGS